MPSSGSGRISVRGGRGLRPGGGSYWSTACVRQQKRTAPCSLFGRSSRPSLGPCIRVLSAAAPWEPPGATPDTVILYPLTPPPNNVIYVPHACKSPTDCCISHFGLILPSTGMNILTVLILFWKRKLMAIFSWLSAIAWNRFRCACHGCAEVCVDVLFIC